MRGIEVPDREEDFTADAVELFFDLAYVFAFSQLVGLLIVEPTWSGVGKMALLFGLLWLPWQQLTWALNAVSGNSRAVRLAMLVATAISIPMAASTTFALGAGGSIFAFALSGIMLVGFTIQIMGSGTDERFTGTVVWWIAPNVLAIAILIAGTFVDGNARIWIWGLSLSIVFGAMVLAGRGEWMVRIGHMAERHGLIIIIALGEVIVAIGLPVVAALGAGQGIPGPTAAALIVAGLFAGLLWWGYFDRISPALEHRGMGMESDRERGRYVRDVYTWAHAPIVAGIIFSAAALEEIALHPSDPVHTEFLAMLAGGLLLMSFGVTAAIWRAYRVIAWERLLGAAAIAALVFAGSSLEGGVLLTGVVLLIVGAYIVEHRRIET